MVHCELWTFGFIGEVENIIGVIFCVYVCLCTELKLCQAITEMNVLFIFDMICFQRLPDTRKKYELFAPNIVRCKIKQGRHPTRISVFIDLRTVVRK